MSLVGGSGYLYEQGGMLIDSRCAEPCCGGGVGGDVYQMRDCSCPGLVILVRFPPSFAPCVPGVTGQGTPEIPPGTVFREFGSQAGRCWVIVGRWLDPPIGITVINAGSIFDPVCLAGCGDGSCVDHSGECPPPVCTGWDLCDGYNQGPCHPITQHRDITRAVVSIVATVQQSQDLRSGNFHWIASETVQAVGTAAYAWDGTQIVCESLGLTLTADYTATQINEGTGATVYAYTGHYEATAPACGGGVTGQCGDALAADILPPACAAVDLLVAPNGQSLLCDNGFPPQYAANMNSKAPGYFATQMLPVPSGGVCVPRIDRDDTVNGGVESEHTEGTWRGWGSWFGRYTFDRVTSQGPQQFENLHVVSDYAQLVHYTPCPAAARGGQDRMRAIEAHLALDPLHRCRGCGQ